MAKQRRAKPSKQPNSEFCTKIDEKLGVKQRHGQSF